MTDKYTLKDVYESLENAPLEDVDIVNGNILLDPQRAALAIEYAKAKTLEKIAEELGEINKSLNMMTVLYLGEQAKAAKAAKKEI